MRTTAVIDTTVVYSLAKAGASKTKIANALGVNWKTLDKHLANDSRVWSAYNKGKGRSGVTTRTDDMEEREAIQAQPEYAVRHFIRTNPGASVSDIRNGLRLTDDIVSDCLAVLWLDKGVIRGVKRDGETRFFFIPLEHRKPNRRLAA